MITRKFSFIKRFKDDILSLLVLFLVAIPARIIQLDKIPYGLHGDEAWTGLDARFLLKTGHIDAYVGSALGQPTGPLHLTALFFKMFGDSIYTLRLSMAVFGIATVVIAYVFFRLYVKKEAAFLATMALAFSLYHIHFSRIAFMLIAMPFFEIAALILLILARRRNNFWLIALSGIATGLGMYSYNAYLVFPLTILVLLAYDIIIPRFHWRSVLKFLTFILFFAVVSYPLLTLMVNKPKFYFAHHKSSYIFNTVKFKSLTGTNFDKARALFYEGLSNTKAFLLGGRPDGSDGFGKYHTFGIPVLLLSLVGIVYAIKSKRSEYLFPLLSIPFFLSACFMTIDAVYRRQFLNLPYIYLFAAVGFQQIIGFFKNHRLKEWIFVILFALMVLDSAKNVYIYFFKFPYDQETKFVFVSNLMNRIVSVKESRYPNSKLFLGDTIWKCQYETVRYLLPNEDKCIDQ